MMGLGALLLIVIGSAGLLLVAVGISFDVRRSLRRWREERAWRRDEQAGAQLLASERGPRPCQSAQVPSIYRMRSGRAYREAMALQLSEIRGLPETNLRAVGFARAQRSGQRPPGRSIPFGDTDARA